MQLEFDKEHDVILKQEESKCNGGSKGMFKAMYWNKLFHKYVSTMLFYKI